MTRILLTFVGMSSKQYKHPLPITIIMPKPKVAAFSNQVHWRPLSVCFLRFKSF
ncbi:hypothetical protein MTR67_021481 [Solanum verrucosum]|uniref:Uncharacterized protein n=1 Tax=Solanum verrucosum TaxID=315347 RepID=A0AAF0QRJ7_SOLVR|nr:hypothetical protein MTR67_021481 [Solanum verrucosum]